MPFGLSFIVTLERRVWSMCLIFFFTGFGLPSLI